jgi:DNA-binding response OmpR family regulator
MPRKILIVEDDEASRTGLTQLIARHGFEVISASTFEEGKRLLQNERPDILITDLRLGEFNGLQLVAATAGRIPSILVTAFSDPVLEAEARKLGARYVVKPISATALISIINSSVGPSDGTTMHRARRWTRKPVPGGLPARVDTSTAVVVDVSYGGLRLEFKPPPADDLPSSFDVKLSDVAVHVDLVWQNRAQDGSWLCGAAVTPSDHASTRAWYGVVDAIA